jgi:hypothetical protein
MNVHTPPPATIDLATIKQYEVLPRVETLRLRGPRRMAARRHRGCHPSRLGAQARAEHLRVTARGRRL